VRLLLVDLEDLSIGWGKAQEMRGLIQSFAESGKPVVIHMGSVEEKTYYIASAASEVYVSPSCLLNITGLSVEMAYFKEALDRLGVEAQMGTQGRYKGADEIFTRTAMSDETREATSALIEGIFEEFLRASAQSRGKTPQEFRELVDRGPLSSSEALEAGMIDGVLYRDEVVEAWDELLGETPLWIPAERYGRGSRFLECFHWRRPKLAILYADGLIHGGAGPIFGESTGIGPEPFARAMAPLLRDRRFKGLLIRLDTPGGTVSASDELRHELAKVRSRMPVVVSMSDVSASGGYYLCTAADRILAHPLTLTGSIGVVWGKFHLQRLLERLGVGTDGLSIGKRSNMNSLFKPYTEEDQEVLSRHMSMVYNDFVSKVAQGRKMSLQDAEKAAEGRVWTGLDGQRVGLVDELGGMEEAIQCLARLAKVSPQSVRQVHISLKPLFSGFPFWPGSMGRFQRFPWLNWW